MRWPSPVLSGRAARRWRNVAWLQGFALFPELDVFGFALGFDRLEEDAVGEMLDRVGYAQRLDLLGIRDLERLPVAMAVARAFDQVLAGLRRDPGVDEIVGRRLVRLADVEQSQAAEPGEDAFLRH